MKTNYLLPNKYKIYGWVLFIVGLIAGSFLYIGDFETDALTVKVLAIFNDNDSYFNIIENSIVDELIVLSIIIGGLIVGFSREKVEDEFIYKLRKDSLVWAMIFNYTVLAVATVVVYNLDYFDVLIFNMFTPLIFFIVRFNFLKYKLMSHEE